MILDVAAADALELFGLAAAILALGGVYWMVRNGEQRAPMRESSSRRAPPAGP